MEILKAIQRFFDIEFKESRIASLSAKINKAQSDNRFEIKLDRRQEIRINGVELSHVRAFVK